MNLAEHKVQHLQMDGFTAAIICTRYVGGEPQSLIHAKRGETEIREWVKT